MKDKYIKELTSRAAMFKRKALSQSDEIETLRTQLAKANERVKELEQAILSNCYDDPSTSGKRLMALASEQLRKEQPHD